MNPQETEQGRMNIWDKALSYTLQGGKSVDEAIQAAERAVEAFEARFHADIVAARKELGSLLNGNEQH